MATRILAALVFFTRLPFWKLGEVPAAYFKNIVSYWPIAGWTTAGCMALALYAASLVLPPAVALTLAIATRLLATGCLHEDGLADFFDGFGGATTRERTLAIMKDSRTGSYGVIGLIVYFALLYLALSSLPVALAGSAILAGDPYSKAVAGQIINRLPYARKAEEAKNQTVYSPMRPGELALCGAAGLAPLLWLPRPAYALACLAPPLCWCYLTGLMKKRLGGYTGDCCGATFLLCELCFYLAIAAIYHAIG